MRHEAYWSTYKRVGEARRRSKELYEYSYETALLTRDESVAEKLAKYV